MSHLHYLCQSCNPLPKCEIFGLSMWLENSDSNLRDEIIHRKGSACEKPEDLDRVDYIVWEDLKYEFILPEDYVGSEDPEPDFIISTRDRVGNLAQIARLLLELNVNIKSGKISGRGCFNNGIFLEVELIEETNLENINQRFREVFSQCSQVLNSSSDIDYPIRFKEGSASRTIFFDSSNCNNVIPPNRNHCQTFRIIAQDRPGLTADIARLLYEDFRVNLIGGHMVTNKQYATFEFNLYLEDISERVGDIQDALFDISSVFNVYLEGL